MHDRELQLSKPVIPFNYEYYSRTDGSLQVQLVTFFMRLLRRSLYFLLAMTVFACTYTCYLYYLFFRPFFRFERLATCDVAPTL